MKKNSKVMNVVMSLFLVLGMLFQVTPVTADGDDYSLNWVPVTDSHDELDITSENTDAVAAVQNLATITVADNSENGKSVTALVVPNTAKYVNGTFDENYPNPNTSDGQSATIRAIVIPWADNLSKEFNQPLDPSQTDTVFWDNGRNNLIVPVGDTEVSLENGFSFVIADNTVTVVNKKIIHSSISNKGIKIGWGSDLADLFYENDEAVVDENNNTITISAINNNQTYSGQKITNNIQTNIVEAQDVPSSVLLQNVNKSEVNEKIIISATIVYGENGKSYISSLITNPDVSFRVLDNTHDRDNAINIERNSITITNENQNEINLSFPITVDPDSSFDLVIDVPFYNSLSKNTNQSGGQGGGDGPQGSNAVPMNTKIEGVVNDNDTGTADFVLTCPATDSCKAYLETVKSYGKLVVEDNSESNDKEFPNANQSRDNIFVLNVTGSDLYSLTLDDSYFEDDNFYYHAVRGKVEAPGYLTLKQGDESRSYPPFTGACEISFDEGNNKYVIDCQREIFRILDSNTSVGLELSIPRESNITLDFGQEYEVSQDNKKLTFTEQNLLESGERIIAGDYSVILNITRMNDRTFPGVRHFLSESFHFPDVNNNIMPENIRVKTWEKKNEANEEIGTGLELSCTGNTCSAYLNKIYTDSDNGMKKGNSYFDKNSGFVLYAEGSPVPHYYPTDKNIFTPIYDPNVSDKLTALKIDPEVLMEEGIPTGTVFVDGSIGVLGWGVSRLYQFDEPNGTGNLKIKHGAIVVPSDQIQLSQNELKELVVVAPTEMLNAVDHVEFDSTTTPKGGALLDDETRTIERIDDTYSKMTVSIKELYHLYSWIRTGKKTVVFSGGGYYGVQEIVLNHDYLTMPTDVRISVIGSGLIITNTQTNKPEFLREVALGKDRPALGEFNTRINFDTGEMMQDGFALTLPRSQFTYSLENNKVLVSVNWKQLTDLNADKNTKYLFQLWDSTYGWANKQDFSLSLNPIILAYAAQHPEEFTYEELEELNRFAITNGEEGLQNVQVNQTVDKTGTTTNVTVAGEVAAAITASDTAGEADIFDLNNENKEDLTVDVSTTISDIPQSEVESMIDAVGDSGTVKTTGIGFDITITKQYTPNDAANWFEKFKRKAGVNTIAELPYPIAIRFPLPNKELKTGEKYIMLREHKGVVSELDYEIKDGYIIVYSDQFSSFALVTKERADEAVSQPVIGEKPAGVDQTVYQTFVTALTTALNSNSKIIPASSMDVKGEVVDKLTEGLPSLPEGQKYVVQSYLDVQFESITNENVIFNITPMVRVVKMAAGTANTTAPDGNAVTTVKEPVKLDSLVNSTKSLQMMLPIPSDWLSGEDKVFVTHVKENGKTYIYTGTKVDNGVQFTNPHGFSSFSVTKGVNPAKASVGDTGYTSLQDAVDDVANNGTVTVNGTGQSAVVARETSFKLVGDAALSAGDGYQMIKGADGVYTFVKVSTSTKDSYSGSSVSKKGAVVTCQMAGYPASYSWNETAKACQPGYIDNNGVFHLTSGNMNKRVGVVNTSDKGLGGNIAGLICSTLAAIAAAYALRKWN